MQFAPRWKAPLAALLSLLAAPLAQASGPTEMIAGVYVDPGNPERWILRYDNTGSKTGFLYSGDSGATFSLICTAAFAESALRALGSPDQSTADSLRSSLSRNRLALVTGDGRTLLGTTSGAFIDDGTGCSARRVDEIGSAWIGGLAAAAGAPEESYLITNGSSDDPNEGLWKRAANGTFSKLSGRPVPPAGEVWTNIGLVATTKTGGGTRLYTTSLRYKTDGSSISNFLMRTDDGGAHWTSYEVDVPERVTFELLAVDPTDENRVVAMLERSRDGGDFEANKDTILVSHDGGETFAPYFDATKVTGAMFDPDGTLWISDLGLDNGMPSPAGIYKSAPGLGSPPSNLSANEGFACIGRVPGSEHLLVCRMLDFGTFDPATETYTKLVEVTTVQRIHTCSGQDVVADCRDQLCEAGWCGPGHYAAAPACSAYNERYCGNGSGAPSWADAGSDGGSGDGDGEPTGDGDFVRDAGAMSDSGLDESAAPRRKDNCALHPAATLGVKGGAALSLGAFLTLLFGAVGRRLGGRTRVRVTNPSEQSPREREKS